MPLFFNKHSARRFRMPWGAAIGAVGSIAAASMSSDKNGGAGTTTVDKSPWLPAQGWITDNLASGQALQDQYTKNPQSAQQQQAVNNIYGQSDYMRSLVPSLLGQIGQQQVGFDPSNPTAKPKAWSWDGLLGSGPNLNQGSMAAANVAPPAPAPAAAPAASSGMKFVSQPTTDAEGAVAQAMGWDGKAGYGAFKYGDTAPVPGTPAYLDQQLYFLQGGADPRNLYGRNGGGLGNLGGNAGAASATGAPGTSADGTY